MKEIEAFDIGDPNEKPRKSKSVKTRSGRGDRGRPRHKGPRKGDPDSSSSESEGPSPEDDTSDMESVLSLPYGIRKKGPRHPGLQELKPTDPQFNGLLSYRFYRLFNRAHNRTGHETGKIKDHIKRLELTIRDMAFDGSDLVLILDFLNRFTDECTTLEMSEAQAFITVQYFLKGDAAALFRSSKATSRSTDGISCWPEAVHFLLRTYATPSVLREAVIHDRTLHQGPNESDTVFGTRVSKACNRIGNVVSVADTMTKFIYGLSELTRTATARYLEEHPRSEMTYERLVHFAQD